MIDSYLTIENESENELVIQRSRFIAFSFIVNTEEQAYQKLSAVKKAHNSATHNCYAYILSPCDNITRNSDDKEPAKTAGYPILEAIKGKTTYNTMVVVTRYFGGIKLGTGGLSRAYGESASLVLDKSGIVKQIYSAKITLKTDYNFLSATEKTINSLGTVTDRQFDKDIKITAVCPAIELDNLKDKLNEITNGDADVTITDYFYHPYKT